MDIYKSSLFIKHQKKYKHKYGIDIRDYIKPKSLGINFKEFEQTHLTPKQLEVLRSIEKYSQTKIILCGGIASGKTFLACYLFLKILLTSKNLYSQDTNNFILGNSQKSLELNVLGQFDKIASMLQIPFIPKYSNTSYFEVDSLRVNLYGGDKASDFERFRGSNSAIIYINEATTLHKETLIECLKRLRVGQQTIIFDTNPDHPEHYFKTDYINNTGTYATYNFTTYDNPLIPNNFIKTQEQLYKDQPTYKARVLLGEWVASHDTIFTNINLISNYEFKSPIAYLDPAYSIGGDNSALCVLERVENKYYAFIFQEKLPASDPRVLNTIKTILLNLNVHTLYIEDRDNTTGQGSVTKTFMSLRAHMNHYYRIAPIKPISNKFTRIATLIGPINSSNLSILDFSSKSAISDIYKYKGDGKGDDDSLDSLSALYMLLTLEKRTLKAHFTKIRLL
ncbi:PBSX family phage terminase large subunit (plasmid) [Borrelia miyamotoi]|uniref:PBSX family phage terminase large subunit n=2 Tax=Borrelia miyamotoi TaxID=47466 RepID=A0A481YEH5_9SPIR|nr:PBSX family phage terminase large subunit [Borrelia miyamotoi]ATQ19089.1 PBSX family phage terminase large subunit [Borrelia miyamotoi]QBK63916.1 PBSX family phage terminase large subunit [Borrelia miyamotoi]QBK65213.1 PBSX family phage terminase large subunit [Borrelia miyamotoi]QBL99386.1 PBSX family phage terminase large subunit [Borrelia miyamotoi]WDE71923.1 PBSX family phage terminase large subunit [Borrelia miyamotoi]